MMRDDERTDGVNVGVNLPGRRWRVRTSALGAAVAAAALVVSACGQGGGTGAKSSGDSEPSSYKIGYTAPLTGPNAISGGSALNGALLAAADINAAGGINGRKVEILSEDSAGQPQTGVAAFQKLVNVSKVAATLSLNSGVVVAEIPVAEQAHSILFDIGSTSPQVKKNAKGYTFSNYPKAEVEGAAEAKFAFETLGAKTAAILSVNVESGQGQRKAIVDSYKGLGGKVVSDQTYKETDTTFQTLLTRVKSAKPDVIILAAQHEAGKVVKQARELGIKTTILSFSSVVTDEFLQTAGSAAEGSLATSVGWDPNDTSTSVQNFITNFTKKFNAAPTVYSATSYDAVQLIANGIKANGYSADGIKKFLHTVSDYPGISGKTTIEDDGMPIKPVYFKVVKDGKWVAYAS